MPPPQFHIWLSRTLGQPVEEVSYLLSQEMAVEFLMSWSLFEARCFPTFMKLEQIEAFATRVVANEGFDSRLIEDPFQHFHLRYQDEKKRRNLFQQQNCPKFRELAQQPAASASGVDVVFFCTAVAYRFRNNMFHGSKGVRSWLQYREQIERCSAITQHLTTHAESLSEKLKLPSQAQSAA